VSLGKPETFTHGLSSFATSSSAIRNFLKRKREQCHKHSLNSDDYHYVQLEGENAVYVLGDKDNPTNRNSNDYYYVQLLTQLSALCVHDYCTWVDEFMREISESWEIAYFSRSELIGETPELK
jgi:hypothetical protein